MTWKKIFYWLSASLFLISIIITNGKDDIPNWLNGVAILTSGLVLLTLGFSGILVPEDLQNGLFKHYRFKKWQIQRFGYGVMLLGIITTIIGMLTVLIGIEIL